MRYARQMRKSSSRDAISPQISALKPLNVEIGATRCEIWRAEDTTREHTPQTLDCTAARKIGSEVPHISRATPAVAAKLSPAAIASVTGVAIHRTNRGQGNMNQHHGIKKLEGLEAPCEPGVQRSDRFGCMDPSAALMRISMSGST